MKNLTSENRRLNYELMKLKPCPVNKGALIKITRSAFIRICKYHHSPKYGAYIGVTGVGACDSCKIKEKVKTGEKFKAPKGIKFYKKGEFETLKSELSRGRKPFIRPIVNEWGAAI